MDVDAIHKALANPVRRRILGWLKEPERYFSGQEHPMSMGVCAKAIGQRAGLSQSTISVHLSALADAGLVASQRIGQWIFFKRDEVVIRAFIDGMNSGL
ncbi:transcriptional regulator [Oxalobacteraceae bacterium CAVE-383]|nr:transcriptional regulator [Oxalobacteraceae bacterium CAVE-383]